MAAAELCLCCRIAASSSVPGRGQKENTDPEPGGSLAFGIVTASGVAQNQNVGWTGVGMKQTAPAGGPPAPPGLSRRGEGKVGNWDTQL